MQPRELTDDQKRAALGWSSRRDDELSVVRGFTARGVFKTLRLARSRFVAPAIGRPLTRARGMRPVRRVRRATARAPGRKADPPLAHAGGGR
jgi:hypothetical protein